VATSVDRKQKRVLSTMPNRLVRDQCEYGQGNWNDTRHLLGVALASFCSCSKFLIRVKCRFVKNGTANFGGNIPTEIRGPPPEVIRIFRLEGTDLNSDRSFANLRHNGKNPNVLIAIIDVNVATELTLHKRERETAVHPTPPWLGSCL